MRLLFSVILIFYLLSVSILVLNGYLPIPQWYIILYIVFFFPLAYVSTHGILLLEHFIGSHTWMIVTIGILIGLLIVSLYSFQSNVFVYISLSFFLATIWHLIRINTKLIESTIMILLVFFIGYNAVWNLNYVGLNIVIDRLYDPIFINIDLFFYSLFYGKTIDKIGIFPLFSNPQLFTVLENSYIILFPEILIVAYLNLIKKGDGNIVNYIAALFICYLIGLLIFIVFPAVGPCIYYPETFKLNYQKTLTYSLMQTMRSGFEAVKESSRQLNSIGYFVAMPSLHVAITILSQYFLLISRLLFWIFMPINILIILSTFFLGYHYLVDIPSGILLAIIVIIPINRVTKSGLKNKVKKYSMI